MDEEMVCKVHNYEESDLPERTKVALSFAEAWVLHQERAVDDELLNEMKRHFSEPQIVELAVALGMFEFWHKFNSIFDVPPPVEGIYSFRIQIPETMGQRLKELGIV